MHNQLSGFAHRARDKPHLRREGYVRGQVNGLGSGATYVAQAQQNSLQDNAGAMPRGLKGGP
jgi:hypothetical protein